MVGGTGMLLRGLGEGVLDWVVALHKIRHPLGRQPTNSTYWDTATVELNRHMWKPQKTLISA